MKIIKATVSTTKKSLSAKYTKEIYQTVKHVMHDEAADELARILQEEIDREIVEEIITVNLVDEGWSKVPIKEWHNNSIDWLEENMQDEYRMFHSSICFKNQQDATMYVLRWTKND